LSSSDRRCGKVDEADSAAAIDSPLPHKQQYGWVELHPAVS
jgi:hypothetical protein